MSIPTFTTPGDVERIVSYLRTKPVGVAVDKAAAVMEDVLDKRKVAAFTRWKITRKEDDRLKLDERGWRLARGTVSLELLMREILDNETSYRSALEWFYHQQMDSATNADVVSHWNDYHADEIATEHEGTMKEQALCFFRVVEAAGLGKVTLGRKGFPTRLDLNRASLSPFIDTPTADSTGADMLEIAPTRP